MGQNLQHHNRGEATGSWKPRFWITSWALFQKVPTESSRTPIYLSTSHRENNTVGWELWEFRICNDTVMSEVEITNQVCTSNIILRIHTCTTRDSWNIYRIYFWIVSNLQKLWPHLSNSTKQSQGDKVSALFGVNGEAVRGFCNMFSHFKSLNMFLQKSGTPLELLTFESGNLDAFLGPNKLERHPHQQLLGETPLFVQTSKTKHDLEMLWMTDHLTLEQIPVWLVSKDCVRL